MHLETLPLTLLGLLAATPFSHAATTAPKRGLVHVRNTLASDEDPLKAPSPLTWYYNYQWNSSPSLASSNLSFVPMLWGAPGATNDTTFLKNMTTLLDSMPGSGKSTRSVRVRADSARLHVLGFNQPDEPFDRGGSNISASDAAELWVANFVPLREKGVRVGLPCMQADKGPEEWLLPFVGNCSAIMEKKRRRELRLEGSEVEKGPRRVRKVVGKWFGAAMERLRGRGKDMKPREDGQKASSCPFDFVPIHAFGNASEIQARVELYAKALDVPVWLTEWAPANLALAATHTAFNETLEFLDTSPLVERHAYFGSFRSTASNIGPNATMLDSWGRLTDVGAWYLGMKSTGNAPVQTSAPAAGKTGEGSGKACTAANPCTGGVGQVTIGSWSVWGTMGLVMVLGGLA